jgi:hypothetical protein
VSLNLKGVPIRNLTAQSNSRFAQFVPCKACERSRAEVWCLPRRICRSSATARRDDCWQFLNRNCHRRSDDRQRNSANEQCLQEQRRCRVLAEKAQTWYGRARLLQPVVLEHPFSLNVRSKSSPAARDVDTRPELVDETIQLSLQSKLKSKFAERRLHQQVVPLMIS